MFKLNDNEQIGKYLSKKIREKGYKSDRAFCKAYLEHEHREVNDDETRKMANRMSQMLRGAKGKSIQVYDLPVFCDLLDASCEEILSAGNSFAQVKTRVTNYSIAFSKNEKDWEEYINREDKLILNSDEYGKNVIDYAIEFQNYEFIKYLMEKNYIWFDDRNEDRYAVNFGAGTSIQRRKALDYDYVLENRLFEDETRMDVIALAIKNNDVQVLDELRAREIPQLYRIWGYFIPDLNLYEVNNEKILTQLASASDEMLAYFLEPFEIDISNKFKDGDKRTNRFIFPFVDELLKGLIENKHSFTESALIKCIEYNKETYEKLKQTIAKAIAIHLKPYDVLDENKRNKMILGTNNAVLNGFECLEEGKIISFCCFDALIHICTATNIIRTEAHSKDEKIQALIDELNEYYNKIVNIKDEFRMEEN